MDYTVHGILQARILKWVAFPFSRGSSQLRDRTQVSLIAGRLSSPWSFPRQNTRVGCFFPSPVYLPNPRIKPRSPILHVDSLPNELCISPGQYTGVSSLSLLQGIFPSQGSNLSPQHCKWIL